MLEAGDSTSVRGEGSLASARLRVPDAKGAVRGSRDETVVAEV